MVIVAFGAHELQLWPIIPFNRGVDVAVLGPLIPRGPGGAVQQQIVITQSAVSVANYSACHKLSRTTVKIVANLLIG